MNTKQVADKLVSLCRDGKNMDAIDELYAENCWSKEMKGAPHELIKGKSAIIEKSKQWYESLDQMHETNISEPIVAGNHFSCTMELDCTFKDRGRMKMEEVCVYEVKNGKITGEQFFYQM